MIGGYRRRAATPLDSSRLPRMERRRRPRAGDGWQMPTRPAPSFDFLSRRPARVCRGAWPLLAAFGRFFYCPKGHTRARFRVHLAVSRWFWPSGGCGKSWPPRRGSARGARLPRWRGCGAVRRRRLRGSVFWGDGGVHWHRARDRVLAPCGGESRAAGRANSTKCICICQYLIIFV